MYAACTLVWTQEHKYVSNSVVYHFVGAAHSTCISFRTLIKPRTPAISPITDVSVFFICTVQIL